MSPEEVRAAALRFMRRRPFRPFALVMKSGEQIFVTQRHGMSFDPSVNGEPEFSVEADPEDVEANFEDVAYVADLAPVAPSPSSDSK